MWDSTGRRGTATVLTTALGDGVTTLWPVPLFVVVGDESGSLTWVDDTGAFSYGRDDLRGSPIQTLRTGWDSENMVAADLDGRVTYWRADDLLGAYRLPTITDGFNADTWVSPDGVLAATVRAAAGPVILDLTTGDVRQLPPLPPLTAAVSRSGIRSTTVQGWTADGTSIVVTRGDTATPAYDILVVDATTGQVRWALPTVPNAVEVTTDRAGRFLAVGFNDGTVRILDPADGHDLVPPLRGNHGAVYNVSVSPDGRYLSAAGQPPGVTVWDTRDFTLVGAPLPIDVAAPDARARFGPDGRLFVVTGGTLRSFQVDPARWVERACELVGRTLTEQEWAELLPGRDYAPACA